MGLTITKTSDKTGTVILVLEGSLDSNTCTLLDKQITEASCTTPLKALVFDMQQVSFVSSAGIGMVIKAKVSLKRKAVETSLINLQPQVKRVFEIMQLLPSMNVFENRSELDEYLSKIQNRIVDEGTSLSTQQ
jgi:anti-sigma B factor antagonist